MKAVVYTEDMEPLTIVDVPPNILEFSHCVYRFPVYKDLPVCAGKYDQDTMATFEIVEVFVERLHRNGKIHALLIAKFDQEELALLLRPEYLAGQLSDLQRKQRQAYLTGLAEGIFGCFK